MGASDLIFSSCLNPSDAREQPVCSAIVFCDACGHAYGCVAYLKTEPNDGVTVRRESESR